MSVGSVLYLGRSREDDGGDNVWRKSDGINASQCRNHMQPRSRSQAAVIITYLKAAPSITSAALVFEHRCTRFDLLKPLPVIMIITR
jgi:hypothetical protein